MTTLALRRLKKVYEGKQVLHGIDLQIADGEFVVIVGPSGCGKSTLIRMIAGLEDISEGELLIDNKLVNDVDLSHRGCAMVFQNYALYPHMTVRENIAYPLKIGRVPKDECNRRVDEIAGILGLSEYMERRPAQLSGGQRQRVAMGRAIVREPAVFLFDEPLSNLDAKLRVQMRIEIRRLHRRLHATSIFVTHDQIEAMTMADKLVVMNGGRVEQVGTPADVYRKPASTFVATFLGVPPMNLFDAVVNSATEIRLDVAPDHPIACPPLALPAGTRITLGIRPEDIEVAAGSDNAATARVELIEELGDSQIAYCQLGGATMAAVLPRDLHASEGRTIAVAFKSGSLHAFERDNGCRLTLFAEVN
jgi:sn-glycerol 3-phosphate transport system ATP-binding protein